MDTLKAMVGIACFTGIALSAADMLKPGEKFNRQIRFIFSLVLMLSVIAPLLGGKINFSFAQADVSAFEGQLGVIEKASDIELLRLTQDNLNEIIEQRLREIEINCEAVQTTVNISDDASISIIKIELKTSNDKKARAEISAMFGIDESCIISVQ
jgi:CCR4-NOT transcriptional regulation complex NOT5 subunit